MSRFSRSFLIVFILAAMAGVTNRQVSAAPNPLAATPTPTPLNCIPIKQAVSQNLVRLTLTGNGELFFHSPLHYRVENLTSKPVVICFPAGQINDPADSGSQSLMLAKTILVNLAANDIKEGDLAAFCINESKHAPSADEEYKLGKMAAGKLLSLAETIDAQSAQGHWGAQMAVWAISDNLNLNDMSATPDPNQPSLIDDIRPLMCLAQDDVDLGQQLLQEANTGVSLYSGENPLTSYCQSQGIPSIGRITQSLKTLGIRAALILGAGVLGCIIVVVIIIVVAIRLFRKRK